MRSFSELTGRVLVWQSSDLGASIPDTGDYHFALFDGQEVVATAHVTWQRQLLFDVTMESGDGIYQTHMDLSRNDRPTVVWKPGENHTIISFSPAWEMVIAMGGPITAQSGRQLMLEPTHQMGYEYAIFPLGGARILTLAAWAKISIGGNPGQMSIEPSSAADPELAALVALAFTVSNEETRLLHQAR